ncbi:hypothetical protein ABL78_4886 [Leptomonas seymouri]|uniref:LIM zinc-binding domain-containing protein n=1 Tax=Leptomonas seymouri TaxID=5684 RepID=A0A0N1PCS1_LEPSE|nr:hypothetical protein ABL78_4886 [Leptomonas seymouri]|eukprot:KPI86048.1 hypothetical protein ABL78_4886 [Leptomonas seymouri]
METSVEQTAVPEDAAAATDATVAVAQEQLPDDLMQPIPLDAMQSPEMQPAAEDEPHHEEEAALQPPEVALTPSPQPSTKTFKPAETGVVAKRLSRSGRQVIREASIRADQLGSRSAAVDGACASMIIPISLNAQYKTIPEEYTEFRAKNRVRSSYRGPVFTVEDVCVACHTCGGPVDPVTRVPVGSLFFHVNCLQCYLCGRREGTAGHYVQVDRQAVCSECAARGYDWWVSRQEALSRGIIFGAIQGDVYDAMDAHDRGERGLVRLSRSARSASSCAVRRKSSAVPAGAAGAVVDASTLNRPTVPGALPPSLNIRPVHNTRNTGRRSFALMERQQYYTQSDNNLLMRVPDARPRTGSAAKRLSKTGKAKNAMTYAEQQRITAPRGSTSFAS